MRFIKLQYCNISIERAVIFEVVQEGGCDAPGEVAAGGVGEYLEAMGTKQLGYHLSSRGFAVETWIKTFHYEPR
jgi:hypothetical protein